MGKASTLDRPPVGRLAWIACALLAPFAGCAGLDDPAWIARGQRMMVASDHAEASRAGLAVLRDGGNAVDAAIAVSLALAVTRPQSTGLGGGGFAIVRSADGAVSVLDYRETAPASATRDMYERVLAVAPQRAPPSRCGHLAAGVPGLPAGLAEIHRRWATRDWATLTAPALHLAERGFAVDRHYAHACASAWKLYERYPELRESCPYVYETHLRRGALRRPGEHLRQPALAALLRLIAEHGADAVYTGAVADAIETEMAHHRGLIDQADLAGYAVAERAALCGNYRGYEIIAMPPPSSGGVCLLEALNILETVPLGDIHGRDPALAMHYLIEAMKHAFADRARWLGDPDFVDVPTDLLASKPYARTLADALDPTHTFPSDTYGALNIPDDAGTSHFCIVDRWGNCVVSTETVNTSFGSLAAVGEYGLIFNNEMDDFTAVRGEANIFGLVQSERNAVAPGKRPLSSMSPTIVLDDGGPVLLLGASGGPRIISSVLNVLVGVLDYGQSLEDALAAVRVHHQWQPDVVRFDRAVDASVERALVRRGHTLSPRRATGIVQAVRLRPGGLVGGSDPRKGGRPCGI